MNISIYQFYLCPQIRTHAPLIIHTHPDLQAASCRDATMYPVGQQASCNHRVSSRDPPQPYSSQRYSNSLVCSSHLSHSLPSMQPLPSGVRPCQLHPHHRSLVHGAALLYRPHLLTSDGEEIWPLSVLLWHPVKIQLYFSE